MKNDTNILRVLGYLAAVLILLGPITLFAQSKKDRDQARILQQEADKAYTARNYGEAVEKYGKAVTLVATNPYAYYRKGFAHFNLKENSDAINALTLALTQGYKPLDIYRIRHYIYFLEKRYDEALADIEKGLKLDPNDVSFLAAQGEILLEKKLYPEAMAVFKNLVKSSPNAADTYYNMARVSYATGDVDGQLAAAESALAKGTRYPGDAFFLLGDARQKRKNTAAAIDAFQKSLRAKPAHYQTYKILAGLLTDESRINDAINILKEGLKAFPNDGGFYTELSWLYSLADRPEDAVEAAKAGIAILPNESTAYTNLCRAYNETRKFDMAIGSCNSALRLKPGDGETYFYLGRAFNLAGRSAEATRHYGMAVKGLEERVAKEPLSADGWYLLGNAYFADNQRDKAIEAYLKGLELRPKFTKARYNLGIIYTLKKNKAAANAQYDVLMALDPKLAASLKTEIDKI